MPAAMFAAAWLACACSAGVSARSLRRGHRRRRPHRGVPRPGAALPVAGRLGHSGRADEPHPPHLGIGFALLILPIGLGSTGGDSGHRRALGGGGGAHPRLVAAVLGRQDDAGNPVPAVAGRSEASGQTVHRRHRGPVREGPRRGADARPDPAVGIRAGVASTELGQSDRHRTVGGRCGPGAPAVPGVVPSIDRPSGRPAGRGALERGRPLHGGDAPAPAGRWSAWNACRSSRPGGGPDRSTRGGRPLGTSFDLLTRVSCGRADHGDRR